MSSTKTAVTGRQHFDQHGWAVFPYVLDAYQVEGIRIAIASAMGDDWHLEQTFRIPQVAALLQHDPFTDPLRELFGDDFAFTPEVTALGHYFGPWHRDTDQGEMAGKRYHFDPQYRMGTAVIYMRDQHPQYAGGLDIIPRVSSMPHWQDAEDPVTVPTRAGDMLVFDPRLQHRATPPTVDPEAIPIEHRKSGIYFTVGANTSHPREYRNYLATRGASYEYLIDHRYPEDVERVAQERGITLIP